MQINNQKHYRRVPDYIYRFIDGSHVLISVGANIADFNGYIQLNETAAFLWRSLEEPKTAKELAAELSEEFDVSAEEAREDVDMFLKELVSQNLVRSES